MSRYDGNGVRNNGAPVPAVDPERTQWAIDELDRYCDNWLKNYWAAFKARTPFAEVRGSHRRASDLRDNLVASMYGYREHPESSEMARIVDCRIRPALDFLKHLGIEYRYESPRQAAPEADAV